MADRHAFRAQWHDYNEGIYFVTICCTDKAQLFGHIYNGEMHLNELGTIADEYLESIPAHFPNVEIWNKVVMPNHIHAVIAVGARYIAPPSSAPQSYVHLNRGCLKPPILGESCADFHHNSMLAQIIGTYKAAVTREYRRKMRAQYIAPLPSIWQRLYHEHIISDQRAFDNIMNYIDNNVMNWNKDCFHN